MKYICISDLEYVFITKYKWLVTYLVSLLVALLYLKYYSFYYENVLFILNNTINEEIKLITILIVIFNLLYNIYIIFSLILKDTDYNIEMILSRMNSKGWIVAKIFSILLVLFVIGIVKNLFITVIDFKVFNLNFMVFSILNNVLYGMLIFAIYLIIINRNITNFLMCLSFIGVLLLYFFIKSYVGKLLLFGIVVLGLYVIIKKNLLVIFERMNI